MAAAVPEKNSVADEEVKRLIGLWNESVEKEKGENGEFIWKKDCATLWRDMPPCKSMESVVPIGKYISDNMPALTEEEGIFYVASIGHFNGKPCIKSQVDFLGKFGKTFVESVRYNMKRRETFTIDKDDFDSLLKQELIAIDKFGYITKMKSCSNNKILGKLKLFDQIIVNGKDERECIVYKMVFSPYYKLEGQGPKHVSVIKRFRGSRKPNEIEAICVNKVDALRPAIGVGRLCTVMDEHQQPKSGLLSSLPKATFAGLVKQSEAVIRFVAGYVLPQDIDKDNVKAVEFCGVGVAIGPNIMMTSCHPVCPGRREEDENDENDEMIASKATNQATGDGSKASPKKNDQNDEMMVSTATNENEAQPSDDGSKASPKKNDQKDEMMVSKATNEATDEELKENVKGNNKNDEALPSDDVSKETPKVQASPKGNDDKSDLKQNDDDNELKDDETSYEPVFFKKNLQATDYRLTYLQLIGGGHYATYEKVANRPDVSIAALAATQRFHAREFEVITLENHAQKIDMKFEGDCFPIDVAFVVFDQKLFTHCAAVPQFDNEDPPLPTGMTGISMPLFGDDDLCEAESVRYLDQIGILAQCPLLARKVTGTRPFLVATDKNKLKKVGSGIWDYYMTHDGWTMEGMSGTPFFDNNDPTQIVGIHRGCDSRVAPIVNIADFANSSFASAMYDLACKASKKLLGVEQ